MHHSRYHKFLRIGVLVGAIVLLFDGGFVTPISKQLSDNTILYLASNVTGVTMTVPPNEFNVITAELTARNTELDAREAQLREREIAARDFSTSVESIDYSTYFLATILFILTVLIVLNYALDYARVRKLQYEEQVT